MNINNDLLKNIVVNSPYQLKYLFNDRYENKGRLTKMLSKFIPVRVGIEFECFGSFGNSRNILVRDSSTVDKMYKRISRKYNITSYSEDDIKTGFHFSTESSQSLNEIRVSILGYKQLSGLYNILLDMKQVLEIPSKGGGIHVHIDFNSSIAKYGNKAKIFACNYFKDKRIQTKILEIFGGYSGSYNKPGCKIVEKGCYVNISRLGTIEFRIGRLTFDYKVIIKWIIKLYKLVNDCKTKLHNLSKSELASIESSTDDRKSDSLGDYTTLNNEETINLYRSDIVQPSNNIIRRNQENYSTCESVGSNDISNLSSLNLSSNYNFIVYENRYENSRFSI